MKINTYNNKVEILTQLSPLCIVAYLERICKLRGWAFTRTNIDNAKRVLEAMSVIEYQQKLFLPVDFELIYEKLETQIKYN